MDGEGPCFFLPLVGAVHSVFEIFLRLKGIQSSPVISNFQIPPSFLRKTPFHVFDTAQTLRGLSLTYAGLWRIQ